ncbi:MAG: cytochrome c nitrite reductase small subunit [Rikenellaceae bacterium]
MKKFLEILPKYFIIPMYLLGGALLGLFLYIAYVARLHTYASDDSATCVNCHVMASYYDSWQHSSHAPWTNCNDCHVPHTSTFAKYSFKAIDGLYHSAVFTFNAEPEVIRAREASSEVIMNNCIRCHTQLNREFVNTGMITHTQVKEGKGKACWDCHRSIPHTVRSNVNSTPHSLAPMPSSPVPEWLKDKIKN